MEPGGLVTVSVIHCQLYGEKKKSRMFQCFHEEFVSLQTIRKPEEDPGSRETLETRKARRLKECSYVTEAGSGFLCALVI
jgi:hypothetical protein